MASQQSGSDASALPVVDIKPLLARLWPLIKDEESHTQPLSEQIADALALFFTNQISEAQASALLICLHFTGLDRRADVMAACALRMRKAAAPVNTAPLRAIIAAPGADGRRPLLARGRYGGGLCDIVGTGGDAHNTFNVSTASSIVASAFLRLAKHGNRASTSKSGSADLLANLRTTVFVPDIENENTDLVANLQFVEPQTLAQIYATTNYAFLFAPVFHPGMRYVAPIRKQLPWRTLFNLLGPLANPVDVLEDSASGSHLSSPLEARVIGVARRELGPVFADALRMAGNRKALVVCGAEDLDEISIAGPTYCWWLHEHPDNNDIQIDHFQLVPADFGVSAHPLANVSPGRSPAENAKTMLTILNNERPADDPLLSFVLINTAALFVVSGCCDDENNSAKGNPEVVAERGPGGGRWKEGVRLARLALSSGESKKQWKLFVEATNQIKSAAA